MHSKNWHFIVDAITVLCGEKTWRCCKLSSLVLVEHTKCFSDIESIESFIMYADQK
jgi:hypothetical protein